MPLYELNPFSCQLMINPIYFPNARHWGKSRQSEALCSVHPARCPKGAKECRQEQDDG